VKRQGDLPWVASDPSKIAWHSGALFISDNVGTQIDGLGHVTIGDDHHWYNGFRERDWGGNWRPRKCDATTIPFIVARGVLLDIAGLKGVDALPANTAITPDDLQSAARKQGTELKPGDVVLIRTGMLRLWGETGSDHEKIGAHDSAGINLEAAKWLVEQKGAMLIGGDTSSLEYSPKPADTDAYAAKYQCSFPVHKYLLVEQGVHIGEFHFLETLAKERVCEFAYVCTTAKIKGTAAGFCLRPLAIK
jgi:kynurenine formamidase